MPSTRDAVLDAAEALFASQGFAGASIRAITDRAGANIAMVKYYFGSKEGLFAAVVERRADKLAQHLAMAGENTHSASAWRRLMETFVYYTVVVEPRTLPMLLGGMTVAVSGEVHGRIAGALDRITAPLREALEAARDEGGLGEVDPATALVSLVGAAALFGAGGPAVPTRWEIPAPDAGPDEREPVAGELLDLFLRACAPSVGEGEERDETSEETPARKEPPTPVETKVPAPSEKEDDFDIGLFD